MAGVEWERPGLFVFAMKSRIIAVGKPALGWAAEGIADYARRLRRFGGAELEWVRARDAAEAGRRQLAASEGWVRVVLDERGEALATRQWLERWRDWERIGRNGIAWLVGGAEGHAAELRERADAMLALAPMTLQHELALVVLLEQIYRVQMTRAGSPYHREG